MTNSILTAHALLPIQEIAQRLRLLPAEYETLGTHGAKLKLELLANPAFPVRGKLILVTATTPTTSGEGKTVVSIGLAQGLHRLGKKAMVTSRELSLGPVFGMKGGAAGGGLSQVEPSHQINLHFHGDFHAITSAHNLLAAMVDSHLFFGNAMDLDPKQITWPRAMDMNDRALRHVTVSVGSKGDGASRETGFVITAASEIMATVQSLRAQGEGSLEAGFANLDHHVNALRGYGVPIVVAINHFPADAQAELAAIAAECERLGVPCAITEAFSKGGAGSTALAETLLVALESNRSPDVQPMYSLDEALDEKIRKVATTVYGAEGVVFSEAAREKLEQYAEWGFGRLPVCIAKTQYSLTDHPKRMGAPKDWKLNVTDVSLSAGAGFVVAIAGNMMLMPGLPSHPRAMEIDVDGEGNIVGV